MSFVDDLIDSKKVFRLRYIISFSCLVLLIIVFFIDSEEFFFLVFVIFRGVCFASIFFVVPPCGAVFVELFSGSTSTE